jgi:hypothetical protein
MRPGVAATGRYLTVAEIPAGSRVTDGSPHATMRFRLNQATRNGPGRFQTTLLIGTFGRRRYADMYAASVRSWPF